MHGELPRWLFTIARKTGLSFRMVRSVWNGEIADPKHRAVTAINQKAVEAGRREASILASQFETIAGGLNAKDPDFHSADVSALVHAARILRGLDRA